MITEYFELIVLIAVYTFSLNYVFSKISFLKDKKNSLIHKNFVNKSLTPPFSGGTIFLITLLIFFSQNNFHFTILFLSIYLIGFMSDTNILKSPNFRFFLQLLILIIFIGFLEISIDSIRVNYFDGLLKNIYFNIFFTTFCVLVLINGTNFIDGLNTIVLGYYTLVLIFINIVLNNLSSNLVEPEIFVILISALLLLFLLNFFELLYLGDNGAYLLSVFFGIYLINIYNENSQISPYYIMNLLWYPAYENLFSIIRKVSLKSSAFAPDNFHLHQIIYINLAKKFNNSKIMNTITGLTINLFNFFVFYFATLNYSNSRYQLLITFISLSIYNLIYFFLKKKK